MERYACTVSPFDQLRAYVTDLEHPPVDEFALVMENTQEEKKLSVILNKQDAQRLHRQLGLFLDMDNQS